jgi:EAL domain-containing protein (putative c-di-GMP-specific phosphodiesterase class I)
VNLRSGRIVGAEVLLRWNHHRLGAIAPGEFIPIAESHGLIGLIGEWVLQHALLRIRSWLNQGRPPLVVAVNLSALQFRNPDLVRTIENQLRRADVPGSCLELELTESATMHDPLSVLKVLDELADLGIHISMDDFGTGYSSFSYLNQMRLNKLKIDQSFVRDLETSRNSRVIVRSIIQMARNLSIVTIAEGVETPGQMMFLRDEGCDEMQGYLFSRPLPVDDFERMLLHPPDLAALIALRESAVEPA